MASPCPSSSRSTPDLCRTPSPRSFYGALATPIHVRSSLTLLVASPLPVSSLVDASPLSVSSLVDASPLPRAGCCCRPCASCLARSAPRRCPRPRCSRNCMAAGDAATSASRLPAAARARWRRRCARSARFFCGQLRGSRRLRQTRMPCCTVQATARRGKCYGPSSTRRSDSIPRDRASPAPSAPVPARLRLAPGSPGALGVRQRDPVLARGCCTSACGPVRLFAIAPGSIVRGSGGAAPLSAATPRVWSRAPWARRRWATS